MPDLINQVMNNTKLISAILPKGIALAVIKRLKDEKNIITANLNYARGTGKLTPLKYRDGVVESEKEVLTVVVAEDVSEDVFDYIYEIADVNKPHGGLMYMHSLMQSSEYMLPDVIEEES